MIFASSLTDVSTPEPRLIVRPTNASHSAAWHSQSGLADVDEISRLRAIAKDHRRLAIQRPDNESWDDLARIPFVMAARSKIIEGADHDRRQAIGLVIRAGVGFSGELCGAVDGLGKVG